MASADEVERALRVVVARLDEVDPETRSKHVLDRTVSCAVPDLGLVWSARLSEAGLSDLTTVPGQQAQVRLQVASDDLVALASGQLPIITAWATGRLRVDASVLDLLKLRALL